MPAKRTALFVLGMHRSGTSALMRVINLLGVSLGDEAQLMRPSDDNQKGFFEHEGIVQVHETLLSELGLNWSDGLPLPENWQTTDAAQRAAAYLGDILDRDFADQPFWGVKDPRHSRLWPLWLPLLKARHIQPLAVIGWRHPTQVAASLHKRDHYPPLMAMLCWMGYSLDALEAARHMPHYCVNYAHLMQDWRAEMQAAATQLPCEWPVSIEAAAPAIEAFLTADLQHHQGQKLPAEIGDLAPLVEECMALYEDFNPSKFDQLQQKWQAYTDLSGQGLAQAYRRSRNAAEAQLYVKKQQLEDLQRQMQQLYDTNAQLWEKVEQGRQAKIRENRIRTELEAVYASKSWKLTKPLRKIRYSLGGDGDTEAKS